MAAADGKNRPIKNDMETEAEGDEAQGPRTVLSKSMAQCREGNANHGQSEPGEAQFCHYVGKDKDAAKTTDESEGEAVDERMNGPKTPAERATDRAGEKTDRREDEKSDGVHGRTSVGDPRRGFRRS